MKQIDVTTCTRRYNLGKDPENREIRMNHVEKRTTKFRVWYTGDVLVVPEVLLERWQRLL